MYFQNALLHYKIPGHMIWDHPAFPLLQYSSMVIIHVTDDCDIFRSVLSCKGPVQITYYGNGEDAA